ncbi:MAG: Ig-like domain-containing protein, partial [Dehalococcoidia bacterium]
GALEASSVGSTPIRSRHAQTTDHKPGHANRLSVPFCSPAGSFQILSMLEEVFIVLLDPIGPLAENTAYTLTVNQNAVSVAGMQLLETHESSFKTQEAGPAPSIIDITPEDGTIGNMAGQPIAIRFDQRMSTALTESAITITPVFDYSVVWLDDDTIAVIQSHAPLDVNTDYSVRISTNAASANGVSLGEEKQFAFTTGIMNLPEVLGTMPESGQGSIPSNHPIQIVFDRSMDVESVEALLNTSPGFDYNTRWYEADMVLQIEPVAPLLDSTTYTITIDAGALSSFGLPLANDYEFTFTTGD